MPAPMACVNGDGASKPSVPARSAPGPVRSGRCTPSRGAGWRRSGTMASVSLDDDRALVHPHSTLEPQRAGCFCRDRNPHRASERKGLRDPEIGERNLLDAGLVALANEDERQLLARLRRYSRWVEAVGVHADGNASGGGAPLAEGAKDAEVRSASRPRSLFMRSSAARTTPQDLDGFPRNMRQRCITRRAAFGELSDVRSQYCEPTRDSARRAQRGRLRTRVAVHDVGIPAWRRPSCEPTTFD